MPSAKSADRNIDGLHRRFPRFEVCCLTRTTKQVTGTIRPMRSHVMAIKKKSVSTRKSRTSVKRAAKQASKPKARKAATTARRKTSGSSRRAPARLRKVVVKRRTRVTVTTVKTATVIEVNPASAEMQLDRGSRLVTLDVRQADFSVPGGG